MIKEVMENSLKDSCLLFLRKYVEMDQIVVTIENIFMSIEGRHTFHNSRFKRETSIYIANLLSPC